MAYDSAHQQVVLFGGNGPEGYLNETWVWDGTNWTKLSPATSPPARTAFAMVYDSGHGQVVLFGGNSSELTPINDTWVWDGTNWTQENPQNNPPARELHAMAYDAAHGQVVLFGGSTMYVDEFDDTWVWDGANWTQRSPATSPLKRDSHAMAYDSTRGQVVLFGGNNITLAILNDTWVWDGTNWSQQSPNTSPAPRTSFAMADDAALQQVLLFGGFDAAYNPPSEPVFDFNDTWGWDGSNWSNTAPQTSPPARYLHAMAYDSAHGQVVLFGGFDGTNALGDTWTYGSGPPPTPTPVITAVVNGASFAAGGVVPGEIATAFGTNLTSSAGINLTSSIPLPTTFQTDSLLVNDQPVALFAVDNVNGQQQINFQVPWEVASGPNATIAPANNGTAGASISVPVLAAQPGIFNYSVGGDTFGAILHANFQLANTAHPAKTGETVLIYCTGLGAVSSPPADGAAGNGQITMAMPNVTIGGAKATVSFSGLAPGFVGLYQINAEVPTGLTAGNQTVMIEVDGASSNSTLLPVQ